ncbi:TetR family transcriptional regulator [Vibrio sp. ES.051]|uniref:TetR/AcrR family transcriptional regulator n=1 Tax=Vibrio sp. ES.051 TaxID=1761909 RepID=UPI000BF2BF3F|nr:TetR/AcrR family transcriptional regulator [Vibrio sp. ES.051]PFG57873.1 TetR family transcriptional regulator [Vibrio sp. ES.051]
MPKRSKEDTEVTIQKIMDAVVDQLLRLGYDKMSYTTLSQQTGISRTGISHHFPKKTDFTAALDARIFKMFIEHLEFEKGLNAFSQSWIKAFENSEFLAILRLLFHHIVMAKHAQEFATNCIDRLYKVVENQFGSGGDRELEWLLGRSLIHMSK